MCVCIERIYWGHWLCCKKGKHSCSWPSAQWIGLMSYHSASPRSRGSTGRSAQRPLGREGSECVRAANVMVTRVAVLLMILQAKKIWWCLEQPCNSLLERHPKFQEFLKLSGVVVARLSTKLLWLGGPTAKPTWIYSSALVAV